MSNPNNPFASSTKDLETSLYAKMIADSVNPYSLYNNADRIGNVPYRYFTTGKFGHRVERSGDTFIPGSGAGGAAVVIPNVAEAFDWKVREFKYEAQHNLMTQYLWASSAGNRWRCECGNSGREVFLLRQPCIRGPVSDL